MKKYHKIQSLYKRDEKTHKFIVGDWSRPELELLQNIEWEFTEKVDGTNTRIHFEDNDVTFGGRTDNAQIPAHLVKVLMNKFDIDLLTKVFPNLDKDTVVTLYGEGYGSKIQKGGKYLGEEVNFVLFDVKVADWWLKREDVNDVADQLGVKSVPVIGRGTLHDGIDIVKAGLQSQWGDFEAEGIVARPIVDLFARNGSRVIVKIKGKDLR